MCGLAAIISDESTEFNHNHFNLLGCFNDERGGDSCGTFIDGEVKYGVKDDKLYRNFMYNHILPDKASIALLHCRKTSYGNVTGLAQAHPIVIEEDGEVKFVVIHNGTITNAPELYNKYFKTSAIGMSDSQIMTKIFYHFGYDVLLEYTGTAAFIIVDYRKKKPEVLIFKGNSVYNEINTSFERPLYCMRIGGKMYFSSIYASLYCINNQAEILSVPDNKLLELRKNKFWIKRKYDRTVLTKPKTTYSSTGYNTSYVRFNESSGYYERSKLLVHGQLTLWPSGFETTLASGDVFFFFHGRLLTSKKCFDFLTEMEKKYPTLSVDYPEIIDYFCFNPVSMYGSYFYTDEHFDYNWVNNDTILVLFDSKTINISGGWITTRTSLAPYNAVKTFKDLSAAMTYDFDLLRDRIDAYISVNSNNTK